MKNVFEVNEQKGSVAKGWKQTQPQSQPSVFGDTCEHSFLTVREPWPS